MDQKEDWLVQIFGDSNRFVELNPLDSTWVSWICCFYVYDMLFSPWDKSLTSSFSFFERTATASSEMMRSFIIWKKTENLVKESNIRKKWNQKQVERNITTYRLDTSE